MQQEYLKCEKSWVFKTLMLVGGFFGAFTYSIRGGVFCNAQTANFVLFAMALGNGEWMHAVYFLIPMSAYFLGAFISEFVALDIKKYHFIRWDTLFVGIEILVVIFLGLLPESAPYQITQVMINLICSMQYNTFRQAESVPMATTFCTNHLRQVGVNACKGIRHRNEKENPYAKRVGTHLIMLAVFVLGGVAATILCRYLQGRAIWATLIPLVVIFINLFHADLTVEREKMNQIPRGH